MITIKERFVSQAIKDAFRDCPKCLHANFEHGFQGCRRIINPEHNLRGHRCGCGT